MTESSASEPVADTLSRVKEALDDLGLRPSRRLGQCFLVDPNLASAIVADARIESPDEVLLEVGPGLGVLTARLLALGNTVLAVEIDHRLADRLRDVFADTRLTLLECDALAGKERVSPLIDKALTDLGCDDGRPFSLIANLPYGISVPLLLSLLARPTPPRAMTATVQLEVAERLVAAPGSSAYGAASVAAQVYGRPAILRRVPREVFYPRPQVQSAVLSCPPIESSQRQRLPAPSALRTVLRAAFQRRRQMMKSTLRGLWPGADAVALAEELGFRPSARPEELAPAVYIRMAERLAAEPGGESGPISR